jgi:hypothetical protein
VLDGVEQASLLTRRRLLQSGGAALAVAVVDMHAWVPALASGGSGSAPAYLRRSSYAALTDQSFTATSGSQSQTLKLLSISDVQRAGLAGADDAFVLELSGALDQTIEQAVHTFEHPALGSFDLFVTPVEQPQSTQSYAIVVDRSVALATTEAPGPSPPVVSGTSASDASPAAGDRQSPQGKSPATLRPAPTVRESVFGEVYVRRAGRGVAVDVSFASGAHIERVHAWLLRDDRPLGVASHRVKGGRADLLLHGAHRLAAGEYDVRLIATDSLGAKHGTSRAFKLS